MQMCQNQEINFDKTAIIQPTDFYQMSPTVLLVRCSESFSGPGSNPESSVACHLSCSFSLPPSGPVSQSFFVLYDIDILKSWGQLFCRMSLNMGSSETSLDSGYA